MLDQESILNTLLKERSKLFSFAWSIVRNIHTAEDVYQEMTIKAFNGQSKFENEFQLLSWARTVTRNRCFDIIKKETNRRNLLEESVVDLIEKDFEKRDLVEEEKNIHLLKECIDGLTVNSKDIIRLRYFKSMQAKKVAELLGRKPDAVYKALQRIYQKLRECMLYKTTGEEHEA